MTHTDTHTDTQTTYPNAVDGLRHKLPWRGLLLVLFIGLMSSELAHFVPKLGAVTIGILLGVLVGNLLPNMKHYNAGAVFAEKRFLPIAIVLLGIELQLSTLIELGPMTLVVIVATISTSIGAAILLGRWFHYSPDLALLIGAGNGICGSSAVAAASYAIKANEEDTGISISVVNLLGTVGIFLLPALVNLLALNTQQQGVVIGGSLQAVGQVVAAGYSVNETVGTLATVVKMGRVLMLGPVVILLTSVVSRRQGNGSHVKMRIPSFIIGFFILSIISSLGLIPDPLLEVIRVAGKYLLIFAMVGIGLRIHLRKLLRTGSQALLFGMAVWAIQIAVVVAIVWVSGVLF